MEEGINMYKKRVVIIIGILLMVTFFTSSISVTAYNNSEFTSQNLFKYGAFVLTCNNIEGINQNNHVGGLSNLNITVTSEQFIIATFPIWGTTLIENEVEIHLTIENFLGIVQTYSNGKIELIGLCMNISWEFI